MNLTGQITTGVDVGGGGTGVGDWAAADRAGAKAVNDMVMMKAMIRRACRRLVICCNDFTMSLRLTAIMVAGLPHA